MLACIVDGFPRCQLGPPVESEKQIQGFGHHILHTPPLFRGHTLKLTPYLFREMHGDSFGRKPGCRLLAR
jgi:hypothetical protein